MSSKPGNAQPLLQPLDPANWSEEIADLRDGFAGRLNVYKVMANHRHHLVVENKLGAELSEIAILRIGARMDCAYERAHHIVRARAGGISDIRIGQALDSEKPDEENDALIVRAVDELHSRSGFSAETTEALARRFGPEAMLDLMGLVGFYSTLGYLLNTFATPIDEAVAEALSQHPLGAP